MTPQEYHRLLSFQNATKRLARYKRPITSRAVAKRGRALNLRERRKAQVRSMLNMGAPAGHMPLPRFPSERERVMFAAHERRKEAGWIRG